MNKLIKILIVALFVLTGCGSQMANVPRGGPPNATAALDPVTKKCNPNARPEDLRACVEMTNGAKDEIAKDSVPPAPPPATAAVATPMLQPTLYVVPTAAGTMCKAPMGTAVTIYNGSDFPVQIKSADVAPLNCDAPYSLSPACVANKDGSRTCTAIIPPHMTSEFVLVYRLVGPIPQIPDTVRMYFTAHVNLGPSVLAPQTGKMVERWFKPAGNPKGVNVTLYSGDFIDN